MANDPTGKKGETLESRPTKFMIALAKAVLDASRHIHGNDRGVVPAVVFYMLANRLHQGSGCARDEIELGKQLGFFAEDQKAHQFTVMVGVMRAWQDESKLPGEYPKTPPTDEQYQNLAAWVKFMIEESLKNKRPVPVFDASRMSFDLPPSSTNAEPEKPLTVDDLDPLELVAIRNHLDTQDVFGGGLPAPVSGDLLHRSLNSPSTLSRRTRLRTLGLYEADPKNGDCWRMTESARTLVEQKGVTGSKTERQIGEFLTRHGLLATHHKTLRAVPPTTVVEETTFTDTEWLALSNFVFAEAELKGRLPIAVVERVLGFGNDLLDLESLLKRLATNGFLGREEVHYKDGRNGEKRVMVAWTTGIAREAVTNRGIVATITREQVLTLTDGLVKQLVNASLGSAPAQKPVTLRLVDPPKPVPTDSGASMLTNKIWRKLGHLAYAQEIVEHTPRSFVGRLFTNTDDLDMLEELEVLESVDESFVLTDNGARWTKNHTPPLSDDEKETVREGLKSCEAKFRDDQTEPTDHEDEEPVVEPVPVEPVAQPEPLATTPIEPMTPPAVSSESAPVIIDEISRLVRVYGATIARHVAIEDALGGWLHKRGSEAVWISKGYASKSVATLRALLIKADGMQSNGVMGSHGASYRTLPVMREAIVAKRVPCDWSSEQISAFIERHGLRPYVDERSKTAPVPIVEPPPPPPPLELETEVVPAPEPESPPPEPIVEPLPVVVEEPPPPPAPIVEVVPQTVVVPPPESPPLIVATRSEGYDEGLAQLDRMIMDARAEIAAEAKRLAEVLKPLRKLEAVLARLEAIRHNFTS